MKTTMTPLKPSPWADIKVPPADYNLRLVAPCGQVQTSWGRDQRGNCLLLVSLDGEYSAQFKDSHTRLQGVDVDLQLHPTEPGKQNLILTLENEDDVDIFLSLCEVLLVDLRQAASSAEALAVVLGHLRRWKAFMANRNRRLLTPEEVRGLIAELCFLKAIYSGPMSSIDAVSSWLGPEAVHQDFVFSDSAVEVKSLLSRDPSTIRISSENQLETVQGHLFLVAYHLLEDPGNGVSLNELVSETVSELQGAEAVEQLHRKLANIGYAYLLEYDTPRFQVGDVLPYRVVDPFPRLVRSSLPTGVVRVGYQIQLEHIADFRCALEEVLEAANGTNS